MLSLVLWISSLASLVGRSFSYLNFDPYALHLIHDKFEKKIESNYYMVDKSLRQRLGLHTTECLSEDGPYCPFLNSESINDRVETQNELYLLAKNSNIGRSFLEQGSRLLKHNREQADPNHEILFFERNRLILDELLYPAYFSRTMGLVFTFETFPVGQTEKPMNRNVTFEVEGSNFNAMLYPELSQTLVISVEVLNLFTPSSASAFVELGVKAAKKFANSIGFFVPEQEAEEMRFGKYYPQGNYIYTTASEAKLTYSHEVTFEFLYARRYLGAASDEKYLPASYIKGMNGEKEMFHFVIPAPGGLHTGANSWKRFYNKQNLKINRLIIGPNLEVDEVHVYFNISEYETVWGEAQRKKRIQEELTNLMANQKATEKVKVVKLDKPDHLADADQQIIKKELQEMLGSLKTRLQSIVGSHIKSINALETAKAVTEFLTKHQPLEKVVTELLAKHKDKQPRWPFSLGLLKFMSVSDLSGIEKTMSSLENKKISEQQAVKSIVGKLVSAMFEPAVTQPLSWEAISKDYPY